MMKFIKETEFGNQAATAKFRDDHEMSVTNVVVTRMVVENNSDGTVFF